MKLLLLLLGGGLAAQAVADMTTVTTTATGVLPIDTPSSVNDLAAMETPPGLKCYDDRKPWPCYGINHGHAVDAINWYCDNFPDHAFKYGGDLAEGHYLYDASTFPATWGPSIQEQHNISVSISVITDKCNPIQVVGSVACNANLRIPIHSCDIDGYDGKHGGYLDVGCLRYNIQPNPTFWPECAYMHCPPGANHISDCTVDGSPSPPIQTPKV
ncbi:hypothetical protein BST61_g10074 [Cercospora zeina]